MVIFLFDSAFFERHQKWLLRIANDRLLRWMLGLNRLPKALRDWKIEKITPNVIHRRIVNGKTFKVERQAAFFTRPRFAEALAYNLSPLVYFQGMRRWQFSPAGAVGMASLWFLLRKGLDLPWYAIPFFGTTGNFVMYTGGDGTVEQINESTWAAARDAASGDTVTWNTNELFIEAQYSSTWGYSVGRAFYPIDTSGIGVDATISAASMFVYVGTNQSNGQTLRLVSASQASIGQLEVADFNNIGSTQFGSATPTASQYDEIVVDATGRAIIVKDGYTKFAILMGKDFDNSTPTGMDYVQLRFSAYTGTASDPYLSVTYSTGAAPTAYAQNNLAMLGVS
jgi:hypothetical protein